MGGRAETEGGDENWRNNSAVRSDNGYCRGGRIAVTELLSNRTDVDEFNVGAPDETVRNEDETIVLFLGFFRRRRSRGFGGRLRNAKLIKVEYIREIICSVLIAIKITRTGEILMPTPMSHVYTLAFLFKADIRVVLVHICT